MYLAEQARDAFVRFSRALRAVLCMLAVFSASSDPFPAVAQERPQPAVAADSTSARFAATDEQISHWIGDLSHDAFAVRQAAAAQLLAAGTSARQQLLGIIDGPDPETRAAARRLVALIDQSEFHRRLEAFAADTDGRQGLTLPGWEKFQKLVGADPPARALFVDMQRQEGALLAAVFGVNKRAPAEMLESRLVRLVQWQAAVGDRAASPPLGSCAAMLFLGSVAEMEVSQTAAILIENLIQRPPIRESLQPDRAQEAMRRLVVGWILHCPNKSEEILRHRLNLIAAAGLEDALPLALDVAGGDSQYARVQPFTKAAAILIVGQLGHREDVERLEPLLEDASVCFPPQMQLPGRPAAVQIRDVALVVMLQLTEQRPADYGYVNARVQQPKMFQLQTLYRDNDQQRTDAIAKWREWRAAQKNAAAKTN